MNSTKQRRFTTRDSGMLYEVLKKAIQVAYTVESKCDEVTSPDMLPPSLVPTDVLYELCQGYQDLYLKLQQQELLVMGYAHHSKTAH